MRPGGATVSRRSLSAPAGPLSAKPVAVVRLYESDGPVWDEARVGYGAPLCATLAAGDQGLAPVCVDFSAWPALSGDHSCSPRDLTTNVVAGPVTAPQVGA